MSDTKIGLSGCILEIMPNNIIRKTSPTQFYSNRLRNQAEKQRIFSTFELPNVKTPEIFQIQNNEIFSFDMEYISGAGFLNFYKSASADEVKNTLNLLFDFLDYSIKYHKISECNIDIIKKLNSLNQTSKYKDLISTLLAYCNNSQIKVPINFCHGDLNMSNMLFKGNSIYLIDFLDSFIESVMIDLVKLKQDLVHFWNLRIANQDVVRVKIIFAFLWSNIHERYRQYIDQPSFKVIECVSLLRIEPYVQNTKYSEILDEILKEVHL